LRHLQAVKVGINHVDVGDVDEAGGGVGESMPIIGWQPPLARRAAKKGDEELVGCVQVFVRAVLDASDATQAAQETHVAVGHRQLL
jgi:hypothetical protein